MEGIFRRPSGVYYARLVVPVRLRQLIGKTELVATTGTRDLAIAKIVGTELVAGWRRQLRVAEGLAPMDLVQISVGSPLLQEIGLLPLKDAATASGFDIERLLAVAAEARIGLYVAPVAAVGHIVPYAELERDVETGGYDVPIARLMPDTAVHTEQPGVLRVSRADCRIVHDELTRGRDCKLMLFEMVGKPALAFAPEGGLNLTLDALRVSPREVDAERLAIAVRITPEQLGIARAERPTAIGSRFGHKRCSEAVEEYMRERSLTCNDEQARRVRGACDLFVELTGNASFSAMSSVRAGS